MYETGLTFWIEVGNRRK